MGSLQPPPLPSKSASAKLRAPKSSSANAQVYVGGSRSALKLCTYKAGNFCEGNFCRCSKKSFLGEMTCSRKFLWGKFVQILSCEMYSIAGIFRGVNFTDSVKTWF